MNTLPGGMQEVREIDLDLIDILNPRERNQKAFQEIVASIKALGLKKPIAVTPRRCGGEERYRLVCGQGRIEAFRALGQKTIPAVVMEVDEEDALVMSLVENIARRHHRPGELLESVRALQQRGYDAATIARKTALDRSYVWGILLLISKGEERLIGAVEAGRIPVATAISIVKADKDEGEVQNVLRQSYESGVLRGKKLLAVRRLIENRRRYGKRYGQKSDPTRKPTLSSASLVRAYNQEVERQKLLIRKADVVQQRLAFLTGAMAELLADEHFVNLLRAEALETLPKPFDDRIQALGKSA